MTTIFKFDRARKTVLLLAASIPWLASPAAAQPFAWINPNGGFYETGSNWAGLSVPGPTDEALFGWPGNYSVGFLFNSNEVDDLNVIDEADIEFRPAGTGTADRTYSVTDDVTINRGQLTLSSNINGGRFHMDVAGTFTVDGLPNDPETGVLTIRDNATLTTRDALLGRTAERVGRVLLTGDESLWQLSDVTSILNVGSFNGGGGEIVIEEGASLLANGGVRIGPSPLLADESNQGIVRISGVGSDGKPSTFVALSAQVGHEGGRGILKIEGGAQAVINEQNTSLMSIGSGDGALGQVKVSGTDTIGNPSMLITGRLHTANFGGRAELTFSDGATVSSGNMEMSTKGNTQAVVSGTDATGNPTTWTIGGELHVEGNEFGTLTIEDGGRVSSGATRILTLNGGSAGIIVRSQNPDLNSIWNSNANVYVGGSATQAVNGDGRLELLAGSRAEINGTLKVWSPGTVTLQEGHMIVDTIDHIDGGTFDFQSGNLEVFHFNGDLENHGGKLQTNPDLRSTTVFGDYTQHEGATLALEIGGLSPGGTHDLITITGDTLLDGILDVTLVDSFLPLSTDQFTLLASDTLLGFFDNVTTGQRLETSDGGGSFVVNYGIGSIFDENRIVLSDFLAAATTPGDFNHDNNVDGSDFLAWQRGSSPNPLSAHDLAIWESNYGNGSAPLASFTVVRAVPEPGTWGLMMLAVTLWLCQRRTGRRYVFIPANYPCPQLHM